MNMEPKNLEQLLNRVDSTGLEIIDRLSLGYQIEGWMFIFGSSILLIPFGLLLFFSIKSIVKIVKTDYTLESKKEEDFTTSLIGSLIGLAGFLIGSLIFMEGLLYVMAPETMMFKELVQK